MANKTKTQDELRAVALRIIAREQAGLDTIKEDDDLISDLGVTDLTNLVNMLQVEYRYEMFLINPSVNNRTWQVGEIRSQVINEIV